jgi:hypothetical protein
MLAEREVLAPGITVDAATDILWTLCSLAVYDLLVIERGWSDADYERWLGSALADALLPARSAEPGSSSGTR